MKPALLDASVRRSVRPSVRLSIRPSVRGSVRWSIRPSVCPSVRPSVRPSRVFFKSRKSTILTNLTSLTNLQIWQIWQIWNSILVPYFRRIFVRTTLFFMMTLQQQFSYNDMNLKIEHGGYHDRFQGSISYMLLSMCPWWFNLFLWSDQTRPIR